MTTAQLQVNQLKELVERQANIIVSTGTGKGAFDDFDADYQKMDREVSAQFKRLGLAPPFPWRSLWEWHGYYAQELPTYASRRLFVGKLKRKALDELDAQTNSLAVHDPAEDQSDPTWEGIDARIAGLINEYKNAQDKDAWQDVGRRSREILIDLGKLIADPKMVPRGQEPPKGADARAWFDRLLDHHANGRDRSELRGLMRKTWDLAQKVTHGDIDDVDAFASAQATVLLVRTTQKLLSTPGDK
ncbi:hypothetical protein [Gordonia rubripertincta]|uniref:Uncharacterized protein n=1 Tax=Gordonia rubripertincta TaxID=36822 RepID=A0ABT4N416_GORRU|nr:hypothetical protein [Gordonia rubripertincta]MCZ4553690.1 hypothetical protein [Gordonia rubripertincta]